MAEIRTKLDQIDVADPLDRTVDPWADFREIEILELNWAQTSGRRRAQPAPMNWQSQSGWS